MALRATEDSTLFVLISGSSGTGKGALARWIRENSARAAGPWVQADRDRGLASQLMAASGGTLFIPEISDWPLRDQKILAEYAATRTIPHPLNPVTAVINTKVVATTSHDLVGRASGALFNAVLLETLLSCKIELPPLVDRSEEFRGIATELLREITRETGKDHVRDLSPEAWARFLAYRWPGNLRELRNVLRLAIASAQGSSVEASDLPELSVERVDLRATREQFEKVLVLELMKSCKGRVEEAGRIAKIDSGSLLAKLRQYGIDPQSFR